METLVSIVIIVFGILQIILFFKIWGMTNDVKAIKEKYLSTPQTKTESSSADNDTGYKFKIDDLVVEIKTDRQMRVKEITEDGKFSCYTNGGAVHVGDFAEDEIKSFY